MSGGGLVPGDVRRALESVSFGKTFDGRGDIVFAEYFDHGLPWTGDIAGRMELSRLNTRGRSDFSCHFYDAGAASPTMTRDIPLPRLAVTGLEIGFRFTSANVSLFDLQATTWDGATAVESHIRVNVGTSQLQYRNSAGAYVNFLAITPLAPTTISPFHVLKYTVNRATAFYGRVLFDGVAQQDLSAVAAASGASANAQALGISVTITGTGVPNADSYITHIIATQNEP